MPCMSVTIPAIGDSGSSSSVHFQQLGVLSRWGDGNNGTSAQSKPRQQQFSEQQQLG